MKKPIIASTLLFLLFSNICLAADYGAIPEKFFGYVKQGKTDAAIEFLYGTNKWVAKKSDQVVNLKNQLSQVNELVGNYLFHELILEEKIGSRYAHLIYLVGYERQPLRFELKLYKVEKGWRFHGVSFDANLTDDIEKAANQKLLQK